MGIDIPSIQLLCCAKNVGVDFSETMMVGRQTMYVPPDVTASTLNAIGIPLEQTTAILEGQFAEPLFALLGARQVLSIDVSDYERPTRIHDFNQPLPASLMNQFSVVHDGGTIEHVFNIPQAFKNCMEMVRVGGHFIQVNEANNYMGHGFWQFCPELIYRIFSRENGFQTKAVLLHESTGGSFGRWYKVDDPAAHHCRIELCNQMPTYICTIAQRVADERVFAHFPQQSDYVEAWKRPPQSIHSLAVRSSIRRMLPRPMRSFARSCLDAVKRTRGPFEFPYYHRISDDDLIHGRI
jgi:hypothetical protein